MPERNCADYVRYQSDAVVLRIGRFVWQMHILSAIVLSVLLWPLVSPAMILSWAVWMTVFAVVQAFVCFRGTAFAAVGRSLDRWALGFDATAILLAAGWGWLGWVLSPAESVEVRNFIGFITGGAVLTGTGTHNLRYAMLATTLLLIMPAHAARAFVDDPAGPGPLAAAMLLIFMALMLGLGWVLRGFVRRGFALQWEKAELARQLQEQAVSLRQARAEADAANAAKSRFLAHASHDLRQPIHSMGLLLASLTREKLSSRASKRIKRLEQSVDALSKLFSSLLDLTQLDAGQITPRPVVFRVDELVEDVCDEFAIAADTGTVRLGAQVEAAAIKGDPLIVRRILQNLIANAIRHSGGGAVQVGADRTSSGLMLTVTDTGTGISHADQLRIFREFERGADQSDANSGFGLGLAIVRRLADAAGISVTLAGGDGEGTRFFVGPFQLVDEGAANTAQEVAMPEKVHGAGRALIVDDDRDTVEATATLLAIWGWDIDARTGLDETEAATLAPPDILVVDHDLGSGRTGLDVVHAVRAVHGDVPGLVITGSSTPDVRRQVLEAGLVLLHKPVRPAQLRSAIIAVSPVSSTPESAPQDAAAARLDTPSL